jgi:hypothetical protein
VTIGVTIDTREGVWIDALKLQTMANDVIVSLFLYTDYCLASAARDQRSDQAPVSRHMFATHMAGTVVLTEGQQVDLLTYTPSQDDTYSVESLDINMSQYHTNKILIHTTTTIIAQSVGEHDVGRKYTHNLSQPLMVNPSLYLLALPCPHIILAAYTTFLIH